MRTSLRHGFNDGRWEHGHPIAFLDIDRAGHLPRWDAVDRAMSAWLFSGRRYVPKPLLEAMRAGCEGLVVTNLQSHVSMPYLAAARRLKVPVVGYVASWDHTVGKGAVSPHLDRYVVQNEIMRSDLVRYHGIDPARIAVTGWPQTDVYHRQRPKEAYEELLRRLRPRPGEAARALRRQHAAQRAVRGEARRAARRELAGTAAGTSAARCSSARIPATTGSPERFGAASGVPGVAVQTPSYTDLEDLATLLQHADVVVSNAGTILLEALVNDRPAVCVLFDEGAPAGERWADRNLGGDHYKQLAESAAFLRAHDFDELLAGIDRALDQPGRALRRAGEDRARGRRRGGRAGRRAGRERDRVAVRMTQTLVLYSRLAFYPVHWLALEEIVRRYDARAVVLAAAPPADLPTVHQAHGTAAADDASGLPDRGSPRAAGLAAGTTPVDRRAAARHPARRRSGCRRSRSTRSSSRCSRIYRFRGRPRIVTAVCENIFPRPARLAERAARRLLWPRLDHLMTVAQPSLEGIRAAGMPFSVPASTLVAGRARARGGGRRHGAALPGRRLHGRLRRQADRGEGLAGARRGAAGGRQARCSPETGRSEPRSRRSPPRTSSVHYLGLLPKDELWSFYAALDCLAVPSLTTPRWKEQSASTLVDGLAMGLPIVASDSGGIADIMGPAGLLVAEGDVDALTGRPRARS